MVSAAAERATRRPLIPADTSEMSLAFDGRFNAAPSAASRFPRCSVGEVLVKAEESLLGDPSLSPVPSSVLLFDWGVWWITAELFVYGIICEPLH